jgi:hypothetical protein
LFFADQTEICSFRVWNDEIRSEFKIRGRKKFLLIRMDYSRHEFLCNTATI